MQRVIKEILDNSNLSKTKLAQELKVSRGTFYNWLDGKTAPNSKAHLEIIKRLGKKYQTKNI